MTRHQEVFIRLRTLVINMWIFNRNFVSGRLVLRPLLTTDFENYCRLVNIPSVARAAHFRPPKTRQQFLEMFNDDLHLAITEAILDRNMTWLGFLSLYPQFGTNRKLRSARFGLGYALIPKFQNHDYMTVALRVLIYSLETFGRVRQLTAVVSENNPASAAVLKQNGFVSYYEQFNLGLNHVNYYYQRKF